MQIDPRRHAEAILARPSGRIDHASAAAFEAALAPLVAEAGAGRGALVLDFADIEYISSVGLRVLMVASRQLRGHEARLVVAALQPLVAEIFAISRFDKVLTLAASPEAALSACSAAALSSWQSAQDGSRGTAGP